MLFCTVAAITLAGPIAAQAQQSQKQQQKGVELGEIIVTAQRRSEKLQDVPLSVTALSRQDLTSAAITATKDLTLVTPGLRMDEGAGIFMQPTLRGITTTQSTPVIESPVATYIDGAYMVNTLGGIYQMPDIQSVEVLKGPQGTLFGRNATAGAILITSFNPNLTKVVGSLSAGYGNFVTPRFSGYISVPIIQDKLAVSLTGYYEHAQGWDHNLLDGGRISNDSYRTELLRARVRFIPWQGADFTLTGTYSNVVDYNTLKFTTYNDNNALRDLTPIATKPYTFAIYNNTYMKPIEKTISLRGTIEIGPGTLTTTTTYDHTTTKLLADNTYTPLPAGYQAYASLFKDVSQEFVYTTHQLGKFRAVAGAFFFASDGGLLPYWLNNYDFTIWAQDKDRSYALFSEVTYDITDSLSLTAGLRYSYEKRHAYVSYTSGDVRPDPIPLLGEHGWGDLTPRVSLLYKVTPDTNVYFTFSEGFKSGVYNTAGGQEEPVAPEKVTAYEVGVKSSPARNVSLTGAVYYYNYRDLQVPALINKAGIFTEILTNAASAHIYGAELNGAWQATDDFRLTAGMEYLHARYNSFPDASINVPNGTGGLTTEQLDLSGYTMVRSPTFSGNVEADYEVHTGVGRIVFAGNLFYTTKFYWEPSDRVVQPAYTSINMTMTWHPLNDHFRLQAWVKNLTDALVITGYNNSTLYETTKYLPPRQFGFDVTYSF
jgi:iron complex outermembrane receptor protein